MNQYSFQKYSLKEKGLPSFNQEEGKAKKRGTVGRRREKKKDRLHRKD